MINLGSILPVGTIIHSMLTTTQFSAEYGDNWVLMDGRSVTGSKYASVTGKSTIPDVRGTFLRAKGSTYNPDGDLAVGTYTADKFAAHGHKNYNNASNGASGTSQLSVSWTDSLGSNTTPTFNSMSNTGGNETAPRSTTVNVFIRIN